MSLSDWFRNSGVWPYESLDEGRAQLARTMAKTLAELQQDDNTDPNNEDGERHERQC